MNSRKKFSASKNEFDFPLCPERHAEAAVGLCAIDDMGAIHFHDGHFLTAISHKLSTMNYNNALSEQLVKNNLYPQAE